MEDKYDPAIITEPFLLKKEGEYLEHSIQHNIVIDVTAAILTSISKQSSHQLQTIVSHLLHHYKAKWKSNKYFLSEVIGSTLLRSMQKSGFKLVRDILSADSAPKVPDCVPIYNVCYIIICIPIYICIYT